jgi:hypothetical protein
VYWLEAKELTVSMDKMDRLQFLMVYLPIQVVEDMMVKMAKMLQ